MPVRASFSACDTYLSCPARWAAGRLKPVRRDWASPLVLGTIVHAAIELAVRTPDIDQPDWMRLCARAIPMLRERVHTQGWGEEPAPTVPMDDGRLCSDKDWACLAADKLHGFRLSDALNRRLEPVACEQRIEAILGDMPFTGSVDYRDRTGMVVDWKTGRCPGPSGNPRHGDQLRAYRLLLDSIGVPVVDARDVYVEHRQWRRADLTSEACADTLHRLQGAWRGMQTDTREGRFALVPSGLCGWCPLAQVCPKALLPSVKSRDAAVRQYSPEEWQVRTHIGTVRKGVVMDDLLAAMFEGVSDGLKQDASVSDTTDSPNQEHSTSQPTPAAVSNANVSRFVDPWATVEGRAMASKWGFDTSNGFASSTNTPDTPPESKPATPAATPNTSEESKPATPIKPADSQPVRLMMGESKPYDPTLRDNRLNLAGYAFTHLIYDHAYARLLDAQQADLLFCQLIKGQWAAARTAFGRHVPDINGLAEGHPNMEQLTAWLDTSLARDTARLQHQYIDAHPMTSDTDPVRLISDASRFAGDVLTATRQTLTIQPQAKENKQ